jgi:hypothetical protein
MATIADLGCEQRPASVRDRVFRALAIHVPVLAWCVYSGLLVEGRLRLEASEDNYFKYLADAFLHGRLNVTPGSYTHDLVHYHGKLYLYWPPMPAVAMMPLVRWVKTGTHDHLLVATLGALNVALLLGVLSRLSRRYELGLRPAELFCLGIFWAFGTTHYYLSTIGRVWYVSEIMAQTFLLLSVLILLGGTSRTRLVVSGLCFAAAAYSRNDLVFAFFFLAAIYWNRHRTRHFVQDAAVFLLPFVLFSATNLAYNAARFDGRWLDNGTAYHNMAPYFREKFRHHGFLSLYYVPYNFWIEVLRPVPVTPRAPYIACDPEGFGFPWASPLFFLGAPALLGFWQAARAYSGRSKSAMVAVLTRADTLLMTAAGLSAVAISLVVFSVMGTGWGQFGSRYSLDYQLMVLVFCLFSLKLCRGKLFYSVALVLLGLAVYIQHVGTHCSL